MENAGGGVGSNPSSSPVVLTVIRPEEIEAVLRTVRIELRPLVVAEDAVELFDASHPADPEGRAALWRFLFYDPQPNVGEFISQYLKQLKPQGLIPFTVVDRQTGAKIGVANYCNLAGSHGRIEIGHLWLAPAFQGTYALNHVVYLLLRHAFEGVGARRVEWKCDNLHSRSQRAALRFGFLPEGVFRQHMIVKGRSRDTWWSSVIDLDWRTSVQQVFETTLLQFDKRPGH